MNVENERTTALKPKNQVYEDDYCIKDKPVIYMFVYLSYRNLQISQCQRFKWWNLWMNLKKKSFPKKKPKNQIQIWNTQDQSNLMWSVSSLWLLSFIAKPKCHCLGTIHPVLFNCSECGNIICKEEELEVCTYCGAFSRKYRQRRVGSPEEEESLRKAIESKVCIKWID